MLPIVTPLSSWVMGAFILTLLYRWLTPGRASWRAVLLGAAVASAANQLVSLFVASFVDTTIGASNVNVGGPLALMLGVFLFVQNILIGCVIVRQDVLLEVQPIPNLAIDPTIDPIINPTSDPNGGSHE